jgi:L-ribulose-5-phosphate 3-epimerase
MKIACFTNSYGRFGPQAAIRLLGAAGIDWLELPIKNAGQPSFFKETPLLTNASTDAEIAAARELIDASGLKVCTCNITSGNPLEAEVLQRTLQKLEIAARFEVDYVVAGGGDIASEDQWPQLVDHLRRIGDAAGERGITYCCETHPGVCQNVDGMLEMLDRVGHPQIRINFDTGNLFFYNEQPDLLEEMEWILPHVAHVHLKDTNGMFQEWHFPALGAGGAVDFTAVRKLLEQVEFTGPCSLEIEGIQGEPDRTLEEYQQRIIDSVNHLREHGWPISAQGT